MFHIFSCSEGRTYLVTSFLDRAQIVSAVFSTAQWKHWPLINCTNLDQLLKNMLMVLFFVLNNHIDAGIFLETSAEFSQLANNFLASQPHSVFPPLLCPPTDGSMGAKRSTEGYNTRHDIFAPSAGVNEDRLYAHALATVHTWYGMDWYWLKRHW